MKTEDIKKVLRQIKQAFKNSDTEIIEAISLILKEGETKLEFFKSHPELKEVYEPIGNNPIDAPDLYVPEEDFVIAEYVTIVEKALGLNLAEYSLEDALNFSGLVWTKVNSYRDASGHIKSTVNTQDAKMPTTKTLMEISKLEEEKREALVKMHSVFDPDIDDISDFTDDLSTLEKEYDEKSLTATIQVTGVDPESLTDWEKKLLVQDVRTYVKDSINRGKSSFKGYL